MNEEAKPLEQMTTAELCESLNDSAHAVRKFRPGSAVLMSPCGHRLQRTREGFKPLNKSKERARRMRQAGM